MTRVIIRTAVLHPRPHVLAGKREQLAEQPADVPVHQARHGPGQAAAARVVLRAGGRQYDRLDNSTCK